MSSGLVAVYSAIDAMTVTFDSETYNNATQAVSSDDIPEFNPTVNIGRLPRRLLLPMSAQPNALVSSFVGGSGALTATWRINDLFLLYPTSATGELLKDVMLDLVRYQVAYADALIALTNHNFGAAKITSTTFAPGTFAWPNVQGAPSYFGVDVSYQLTEIIQ